MKTLDEVIRAFEYTYENDPTTWAYGVDALHYLKKLKRIEAKIEKIAIGNIEDTLSKIDNPPLSLEELKAMSGKPVWIEYIEGDYENEWVLVVKNPERPIFGTPKLLAFARDGEKIYLTISGYGKRWQAYKNEK